MSSLLLSWFAHVFVRIPMAQATNELPDELIVGTGEPSQAEAQLGADHIDH
jgi:hypothetical protein